MSCGAIPPETMNEELFGVARDGEVRPGLFETGSGGTIFLNEVGELPPDIQMKVCRLIHEKTITRVGSPRPGPGRRARARVDLPRPRAADRRKEAAGGVLLLPQRPSGRGAAAAQAAEDIIPFVQFFASELNKKYNMKKKFSQTALLGLKSYDWPGNVRELHNVVERTIVLSGRNPIELEDPADLGRDPAGGRGPGRIDRAGRPARDPAAGGAQLPRPGLRAVRERPGRGQKPGARSLHLRPQAQAGRAVNCCSFD